MQPPGLTEVELAKEDGRWEAAYPGRTTIEPTPEFMAALASEPAAKEMFERLDSTNRYAVLYRIHNTKPASRPRQIEKFVAMLTRGETPYPMPGTSAG
jgi:uncharacterized protein YdeI (YjbR/CyaY-like superfamily)